MAVDPTHTPVVRIATKVRQIETTRISKDLILWWGRRRSSGHVCGRNFSVNYVLEVTTGRDKIRRFLGSDLGESIGKGLLRRKNF